MSCTCVAMGGMGRQFDGGYAEYTCVPAQKGERILIRGAPFSSR